MIRAKSADRHINLLQIKQVPLEKNMVTLHINGHLIRRKVILIQTLK